MKVVPPMLSSNSVTSADCRAAEARSGTLRFVVKDGSSALPAGSADWLEYAGAAFLCRSYGGRAATYTRYQMP